MNLLLLSTSLLLALPLSAPVYQAGTILADTITTSNTVTIKDTNVNYDLRIFYGDSNDDGLVSSSEFKSFDILNLVSGRDTFYLIKPVDNDIYVYFYSNEQLNNRTVVANYSTSVTNTSSGYIDTLVNKKLDLINSYSIAGGYFYKYCANDIQSNYSSASAFRFDLFNIKVNGDLLFKDLDEEIFYSKSNNYDPISDYYGNRVDKINCKLGIWLSETDSYLTTNLRSLWAPTYATSKGDENMICGFNFENYDITQVIDISFAFNKYTYDYYDTKGYVQDSYGTMGDEGIYQGFVKGLGTSNLTAIDRLGATYSSFGERGKVININKEYVSYKQVKAERVTKETTSTGPFGKIYKDTYSFNTLINTKTYDYTDQDEFKYFVTNNLNDYRFAVCLGSETRERELIANGSSNTLGYVSYYYDVKTTCHQYEDVAFIEATVRKEGSQLPFSLKLVNTELDTSFIDVTDNPANPTLSDLTSGFVKTLKIIGGILLIILGLVGLSAIFRILGISVKDIINTLIVNPIKKLTKKNKKKK